MRREAREAIAVLGLLALVAATAGCGTTGDGPPGSPAGAAAQAAPLSGRTEDSFYTYPDQSVIDRAAPGDILRSQPIPTPASFLLSSVVSRAERIMYRTADEHGRPVAATGFLLVPRGTPPDKDGWPVISWAHGTTGLASHCAPSRSASLGGVTPLLLDWLRNGFAVAAADYPGLGPEGRLSSYLSLRAEGLSIAHAALAARHAGGNTVGRKWFAVGISQGGQAALAAGEWAASAKGMQFMGTAAMAPASHLDEAMQTMAQKQNAGESLLGLRGLLTYIAVGAHVYDPAKFPYPALLSPKVAGELTKPGVENLCLDEIEGYLALFAPEKDAGTLNPALAQLTPVIRTYLESLNPAQRTSSGPILIQQGEDDVVVLPQRTTELIGELCAKNDSVDWRTYPRTDHAGVAIAGHDDLNTWLKNRLEHTPPRNHCEPRTPHPTHGK
ncbi:prolyl oligopeptidase family serine peptidase [Streptomyces sp. NPDC047000]|uniref:prolyl oligopeptidase family serine peptidase n=1 Tax=Streptomyces sp. NPDC047000 TaxID=3155474 RepID=UPI0033F30254